MTAATDLPDEVLERIFTEVQSYTDGIKTLLSLMVSCHQVSAVAERVILRSVTVSSIVQLQSLENKLLTPSRQRPGVRSGDLVRALVIHGDEYGLPDDPDADGSALTPEAIIQWNTSIISTLAAVPMLKRAALHDVHTTRGHLSCLRLATQGRLTSLNITLSFKQGRSAGACAAINQFLQLKKLRLNLLGTTWLNSANASQPESPLQLSNVKLFDLDGRSHSTGSFCDWIGRCRFHSRCRLRFSIKNPKRLSDALRLGPFFDAHRFPTIVLNVGNVVLQALATHIASFKHVRLVGSDLPVELLRGPKRLPSHLIVDTIRKGHQTQNEAESKMWSFLSALPSGIEKDGRHIIQVYIAEYQDPPRLFLWSDGGNIEHRAFIGQMVTEAARLYGHGIIIQDGKGRDIKHIVD